jgi:hypothetical protein
MKKIGFTYVGLLILSILIISSTSAKAQEPGCEGFTGKDTRIILKSDNLIVRETGDYYCDTLTNGRMIFESPSGKKFCILKFSKGKYQHELDPKTAKPIKPKRNSKKLDEDGTFLDGSLYNGKKYIYDEQGLLMAIVIITNGKFGGLGKLE